MSNSILDTLNENQKRLQRQLTNMFVLLREQVVEKHVS